VCVCVCVYVYVDDVGTNNIPIMNFHYKSLTQFYCP
jgi:hypothetical protein